MAILDTINAQWLKDRFLVGVNLTTDDNQPYPTALYDHAIKSAAAFVESKLAGVVIGREDAIVERVDLNPGDHSTYYLFNVTRRPVNEVSKVSFRYGGFDGTEFPADWIQIASKMHGQVHLMASPTAFTGIVAGSWPLIFPTFALAGSDWLPRAIEVTYKAGWDNVSAGKMIPDDLLDCIGLLAAILPLDTAGDLIAGAGIASKSVSISGLSTSVGTTSSATNAGYGARILSYKSRLKELWPYIQRRYSTIRAVIV